MRIKKTFQGSIPENKILNSNSTSQTDTYSCEKINEMTEEIYSTEETVIGKWIDGKPLYRKTITFNVASTSAEEFEHGIANIDKFTKYDGFFEIGSNTTISINFYNKTDASYVFANRVLLRYLCPWANSKAYVTLEYTKTTD